MNVNEILELGKLGFSKNEIMGILNAQTWTDYNSGTGYSAADYSGTDSNSGTGCNKYSIADSNQHFDCYLAGWEPVSIRENRNNTAYL